MRCLLLVLALVASISSSAQFKADIIAAGGLTLPRIKEDRALQSSARAGHYLSLGSDVLLASSLAVHPYVDIHVSDHSFETAEQYTMGSTDHDVKMTALSLIAGLQYRQPLGEHSALRFAAGMGSFSDINGDATQDKSHTTFVSELSAGFQWRSVTMGAKFVKPLNSYGHQELPGSNNTVQSTDLNTYKLSCVALELKVTPSLPSRNATAARAHTEETGRIELGLAFGPAMVRLADKRVIHATVSSGAIGVVMMDKYTKSISPVAGFIYGCRIGLDPFGFYTSYVMGLNINAVQTDNVVVRVSAMAGPMLCIIEPNLSGEGTVSVLLRKRISLGVKYTRPWYTVSDFTWHAPHPTAGYRVDYLLGEVKVCFGRR